MMEIVLTHNNMDFDSLSAQYAVTKLWPSARMIPGYPLVGNVRQFLSLYRDSLPLAQFKYIDLSHVSHVFIVDCQHPDRLSDNARKLLTDPILKRPYTIFDHHALDPQGLGPGASSDSIIKPVGSSTTLLVEQIQLREIPLTAFEATLLTIGIYEDTGCLTYSGTGAADAECIAFLLRQGADLSRVNDYIHPKMSDKQVKLLETLIKNTRSIMVSGLKVVLSEATLPEYLDGLATLTRKLVEVEAADAALTIVRMRDRIHLVGRSDAPSIDIASLMRQFGGDGHPGAGSAVVKEESTSLVADKVQEALGRQSRPEKTAEEIMTAPVRTIRARTTMEEASRIMLRYGLEGLTVVEDNQVVGVVSRRDIDQAMHHKLGHAPVQGFMSHPVLTISPASTLSQIQRTMVQEDVGRLPVIDDRQQLVGIVSRKEVLHTLYGKDNGNDLDNLGLIDPPKIQLKDKLNALDAHTRWLFEQIGVVAEREGMVAYVVGGCLRDLLLGLPNFDLDFVIEGSAIRLATALQEAFPDRLQVVAEHDRFQTATLNFQAEQKREIDLSTARTEFYEFPAALPTVEASSLRQDLFRRDFTINALAACLNPEKFGELTDYFGGLRDIKAKVIRTLHQFSFIEDPTRMVRAARFAARLGFKLDPRNKEQASQAIGMGIFDDLGGVRMRTELKLILESPDRMKALDLLGDLGGKLRYLDANLEYGSRVRSLLRRAERLLSHYRIEDDWVVYLGLLLSQLPLSAYQAVLDRLYLSNQQKDQIKQGLSLPQQLATVTTKTKDSQIYDLLHGQSDQSLAIAASLAEPGSLLRRIIKRYLEKLRDVQVSMSGADLVHMGFPQGPEIGHMLHQLMEAKLEGKISDAQDEIDFVQKRFLNC